MSFNRFIIWARIDTSSADTGSSSTMSLGREASAAGPAAELVRILLGLLGPQADLEQELLHARGDPRLVAPPPISGGVDDQCLGDGASRLHARIERRPGILEHRLHLGAIGPQRVALQAVNRLALEQDLALGRRLEIEDHARRRGLAAARFAHQAQCLAGADLERDVVDRLDVAERAREQDALGEGEMLAQPFYAQQRFAAHDGATFQQSAVCSGPTWTVPG
jgi:hypothetical protein